MIKKSARPTIRAKTNKKKPASKRKDKAKPRAKPNPE